MKLKFLEVINNKLLNYHNSLQIFIKLYEKIQENAENSTVLLNLEFISLTDINSLSFIEVSIIIIMDGAKKVKIYPNIDCRT